jgi:ATP:corrinoid adenosyltransferase
MAEDKAPRAHEDIQKRITKGLIIVNTGNGKGKSTASFGVVFRSLGRGYKEKDPKTHIILSGRDAPPEIVETADLVTEMREIKHPYNTQRIKAQPGIEY